MRELLIGRKVEGLHGKCLLTTAVSAGLRAGLDSRRRQRERVETAEKVV